MSNITSTPFASWQFQGTQKKYTYPELLKINKQTLVSSYNQRLQNLQITLDCLLEEKLFLPQWLIFNQHSIDLENQSSAAIIKSIQQFVRFNSIAEFSVFFIEGKALIQNGNEYEWVNPAFTILYEAWSDTITIDTLTDKWLPIDSDSPFWLLDKLNIVPFLDLNRAMFNMNRLERALAEIDRKGDFVAVFPTEKEVLEQEMCLQIGFRLYFKKNDFDWNSLEEERVRLSAFCL